MQRFSLFGARISVTVKSLKGIYILAQGFALGLNNHQDHYNPEGIEYKLFHYFEIFEPIIPLQGIRYLLFRITQGKTLG
jgi:hypothetical protein